MKPDLCPSCGANLAMVGRAHRCIPKPESQDAAGEVKRKRAPRGTFDRNAYQRDLMRKRRAKKGK